MTAPGPVVCDLRAVQSPDHRGRGIGRWAQELAAALERVRPDLVSAYLLDPQWPPPGDLGELVGTGKLAYAGTADGERALAAASVYHCLSPFELSAPVSSLRPPAVEARGMAYSAVAYDLIPLRMADRYLAHPAQRQRYHAHLELLRHADAVLAISEATADEVTGLGGVDPARCTVVGTGVSARFVTPPSRQAVLDGLVGEVAGLRGPFVLYPGGNDARKNIDGLIRAFARLETGLRPSLQLVVVGDLPPSTANHYRHLAAGAGVEDRLVLTGFVADELLARLYQATELLVFPSLAEGFGLPVAEALACGAVACVPDAPPFTELVTDRRARFDPADELDVGATMARCLTDPDVGSAVRAAAGSTVLRWDDVAVRVAAVLDRLALRPRHRWRPSRRVALVSPFPPIKGGVAGYSARLVAALHRMAGTQRTTGADGVTGRREGLRGPGFELDLFGDGLDRYPAPPADVDGAPVRDARTFLAVDAAVGSYDRVVYVLGNSECHTAALGALRRRPGLVVCHDVRLSGLMTFSSDTPRAVPGGLAGAIERNYPQLPAGLGRAGSVSASERDRYGLLLLREVLEHADRLLVSSEAARRLAVVDAGPGLAGRVGVFPFVVQRFDDADRGVVETARRRAQAERRATPGRPYLVASFGIVDPAKRPDLVLEAFARLGEEHGVRASLLLVGAVSEQVAAELRRLAGSLGIAGRFRLTGDVAWEEYLGLLGSADLAVQLRAGFSGEASGGVSECLSAGLPTVVTSVGWLGDLPTGAVEKVARHCPPGDLAAVIARLLADPGRRSSLGAGGLRFAAERTFDAMAEALLAELGY